ncbi:putative uncharacterized protein FLJ45840 isoform X4 [Moschus berezovskii]|uniref:putative uncharacterized protein FLJ45840 isoform X4 n=1 Tax=Moschus berezovskii TaxID=68408 RepID=UPI002443F25D|nr:putative uncharacterized protein FLJ45840 isoform X4 [Moschus berezovskii]
MKPGGGERGGGGGGGGAAGAGMRPEPRCSLTRAGPETPPLPRPPPPPTWFQRCAQAGPAGGRAGGRPGGARGGSGCKSPRCSIQAADLSVVFGQLSPPPLLLRGSPTPIRFHMEWLSRTLWHEWGVVESC